MKYLFAILFVLTTSLFAEGITSENAGYFQISSYPTLSNSLSVSESSITKLRGGISREQDLAVAEDIITILCKNAFPQNTRTNDKLEVKAYAQQLINNNDTYNGFNLIGSNSTARRMYISLCAKALIGLKPLPSLTIEQCTYNAQLALATFRK